MQQSKDLVFKPNQTIMMSNGEITVTQRKAYNVMLQRAWTDLRQDKNCLVFKINVAELKKKAGINETDNKRLRNDIKALKHVEFDTVIDSKNWSNFSLIGGAEQRGEYLLYDLPFQIREALINNDYYTALDLLVLKGLKSKYAVILYEMAIRYQKKQIPEMTVEALRILTGTDKKSSYNDFGLIRQKVLTPALTEINSEKTDILLDYTTTTRGKKTLTIKFSVKAKKNREFISALEESSATSEKLPLFDILMDRAEKFQEIKNILEPIGVDPKLIEEIDVDIELLKKQVEVILKNIEQVDNIPGLLRYSVKKNLDPKDIQAVIKWNKSNKKPSNRDNFEQREYSDEYYDNFFSNKDYMRRK